MKIFFLLLFVTMNVVAWGQSITGKVVDDQGQPIEFASVRLFRMDSTVASGAYTNDSGEFLIEGVKKANYFMKISFSGFETRLLPEIIIPGKGKQNLGNLELQKDRTLTVDEVKVTGNLDALKSGIDKKVYSIDQDLSTRGGTANDALRNIPSIEIDQDGNISLRGDGNVTILIDGRPSTLAVGDGQNLLDALPANSIERVEVVTNPSAKYDPDGTSGIINIVLKKNRRKGFNGIVSATAATGNLYDGNLGLNYRTGKVNTYLNYSMSYYEGFRNNFSDLYQTINTDSITHLSQNREGTDTRFSNTLVLGADFSLSDRDVIAISGTGSMGNRSRTGDLENRLFDGAGALSRRWDRITYEPRSNQNLDVNLSYTRKFKKNIGEWSLNANQSFGERRVEGIYTENYFNTNEVLSGQADLEQRLSNRDKNRITTVQTDMSRIFKSLKARMEIGGKVIVRADRQSTYSEAKDTVTMLFVEDTLANFDYNYDEHVYSIYGTFGQELGKFKYQLGVRGEYARQVPNLLSTNEQVINDYWNFYPSAHVKYNPNKQSEFSISYSRRINRPRSRQLNPFTSYANPLNVRRGNPYLQPEFIDSYDLGYSYAKKKIILTASVFHRRTRDVINRVKLYFTDNSSVVTYANIDRSESTGLELVGILKPFKWMKNTLSFNGNYIDYTNTDTTVDWNNDGFNWNLKYILNIDFWKKTASVQFNARYTAPRVSPQGIIQPRTGIDLAVEKRLLNKRLTIGMRVTDIFNRQGFVLDLEQTGFRQTSEYKWLTRRFYVNVSYRFGKGDKRLRAPRKASSAGGPD